MPLKDKISIAFAPFFSIIRLSFSSLYEHLLFWIFWGILTFFMFFTTILFPVAIIVIFHLVHHTHFSENTDISIKKSFSILWPIPVRNIFWCVLSFFVLIVVFKVFNFYWILVKNQPSFLSLIASIFTFWVFLSTIMSLPLLWCSWIFYPQNSFKQSFLLTVYSFMSRPFLCAWILSFFIFITALLMISLVGFLFFFFPFTAILYSHLFNFIILSSQKDSPKKSE